jgi:gamma-tubulin complex component 3
MESEKCQAAIRSLIASIDNNASNNNDGSNNDNNINGSAKMQLAQRILSSSIGKLPQQSTVQNPARLLKKIERSYRKRINSSSTSNIHANTDADELVQDTMQQAHAMTQELMESKGINDPLLGNVLLLFSRLAGSTFMQQNETRSGTGNHDANLNQPLMAQATTADKTRVASASIIAFKHEQLAIQNDDYDILRECIHALQHIDGHLLQFYPSSTSNLSTSTTDKRSIYNPAHSYTHTANQIDMSQYHGIRIRPNLLPFTLDPIQRSKHRITHSSGSSGGMDALRICAEAGWLYHKIELYIHATTITGTTQGVVPKALASALRKEMDSYHSFLAMLESQLEATGRNSDGIDSSEGRLTWRKLLCRVRGPIAHLRTLAMVVDGISNSTETNTGMNMNGGQLLQALYLHSMHGDERHGAILQRILYESSLPWYDLLFDWTLSGMLSDGGRKGSEFFIVEDRSVGDANLWHGRYLLDERQVPHVPGVGERGGLLSERLAKEILIVGKGINFIRRCLYDSEWEFDLRDLLPRSLWGDGSAMVVVDGSDDNDVEVLKKIKVELGFHHDANSDFAFDISGKNGEIVQHTSLEKTIAVAASQVHRHILSSLFEEHNLLEHLRGLKEILFLGQGDFICTLMDGLHTEFQSRDGIHEIYMISLMNIVHDALRTTNAKFLPKYVTDRVQVRLLSGESSADTFWTDVGSNDGEKEGWDIFTLDYAIDAPLTAVVHPRAMEKYHLVFNLLFRLKKIEWMMNNTWRQSTTLNHALQIMISKFGTVELAPSSSLRSENALSRMKILLRKFAMTRQCMLHFLTNLQSYLMFEVLESGWKDLVQKLQGAKTLDEVISSHDEYLNDILDKSLVGEVLLQDDGAEGSGNKLPQQLRLVLSAAFRFCKMHDKIFSDGVETIQKATEKRRGAQTRSTHGEWGFDEFDADVEGLNFYNLADEARLVEVESISEEFDVSLRNLLSMLNDRINGTSVQDVDVSSPSLMRPTQTVASDRAKACKNDALRFLTFRLDFSSYYGL